MKIQRFLNVLGAMLKDNNLTLVEEDIPIVRGRVTCSVGEDKEIDLRSVNNDSKVLKQLLEELKLIYEDEFSFYSLVHDESAQLTIVKFL